MSDESKEDDKSYEKLRDELTETRIDLKAWIRSMKILGICVSILLFILAFLGYDKIDSIQQKILSKIDEKRLDELNQRILAKEREFEQTLKNFEKVQSKNKELEEKLLASLPSNEQISAPRIDSSLLAPAEDRFQIRDFPLSFKKSSRQNLFLTFNDNFDLKNAELLEVAILQKKSENHYNQYADYFFKVQQKLNKLSFVVDVEPGNYLLRAGYVIKTKGKSDKVEYTFYSYEYSIRIQ